MVMGGNRRALVAAIAASLILGLVPGAPSALATSDGCGDPVCHFTRDVDGDFWAGELAVPNGATIEAGSTIETTLSFDDRTDRSGFFLVIENLDDGSIPFGVVVWVKAVRNQVQVYHEPIAGDAVGVEVEPLGELAWDHIRATVQWNVDRGLSEGDHRLVVAGPTADRLELDVNLDGSGAMDLGAENSGTTGGDLVAGAAWTPATHVDAPGLSVLADGDHTLDVSNDRRLYGYHGPATLGAGAVDACFLVPGGYCGAVAGAFGTNWGHSVFGLERPDGSVEQREASWPLCTFATCPGGPGDSGGFVFVGDASGSWTFTVDEHKGVGTAPNMIAIAAPIDLP